MCYDKILHTSRFNLIKVFQFYFILYLVIFKLICFYLILGTCYSTRTHWILKLNYFFLALF